MVSARVGIGAPRQGQGQGAGSGEPEGDELHDAVAPVVVREGLHLRRWLGLGLG